MSEHLHHLHEETARSRILLVGGRVMRYLFPQTQDAYASKAWIMRGGESNETIKARRDREKLLVNLAERPGPGVVRHDDIVYGPIEFEETRS